MKLLNPIIDKLQELFPPNRVAILLAGIITAVSGSIAAWLAAHFPGLGLGQIEIAGVLGAAVLITLRLLDRWFDRWQEGEAVDYQADVEQALAELANHPDSQAFFSALGTLQGVGTGLADLRGRLERGEVNEAEVRNGVASLADVVDGFLLEHAQQPQPEAEVAVAAPPAPAPAE